MGEFLSSIALHLYIYITAAGFASGGEACKPGYNDYLEPTFKHFLKASSVKAIAQECKIVHAPMLHQIGQVTALDAKISLKEIDPACIRLSMEKFPAPYQAKPLAPGDPEALNYEQLLAQHRKKIRNKNFQPGYSLRYGICSNDRKSIITERGTCRNKPCLLPKPCLSNANLSYTYSSFLSASKCLGISPRKLFPIISHESGFELNARSFSGALGAGQLTTIAVRDVHRRKELQQLADRAECAAFRGPLLKPYRDDTRDACAMISPPQNPAKNFIYSGLQYLYGERGALETLAGWPNKNLSGLDRERIAQFVAYQMYNGGRGGLEQTLAAFIDEFRLVEMSYADFMTAWPQFVESRYGTTRALVKNPKKGSVDTLGEAQQEHKIVRTRQPRNGRGREVRKYGEEVLSEAQAISAKVGKACSI